MEKVNDKIRIGVLLQKLLEQRALLSIRLAHHPSLFSSAVIAADRDGDFFLIDELKPEEGNALLKQDTTLHIEGHLDGVIISFASNVRDVGMDKGIPFYTLTIPPELEYHQRRQAVRIKLSAANPLPVSFSDAGGGRYEGEIEDLSIGGLRARFRQGLPPTLETGTQLKCSFPLPPDKNEQVNSDFIIRVIKHETHAYKPAFLGGQFLALEKQQERKLQRAIMILQRASRQKEAF